MFKRKKKLAMEVLVKPIEWCQLSSTNDPRHVIERGKFKERKILKISKILFAYSA